MNSQLAAYRYAVELAVGLTTSCRQRSVSVEHANDIEVTVPVAGHANMIGRSLVNCCALIVKVVRMWKLLTRVHRNMCLVHVLERAFSAPMDTANQ